MALIASLDAVSASGTLVTVFTANCGGLGPARLYIKNAGANALTAAKVQLGSDANHYADFDTSTFASLASGASAQLLITAPVERVKVLVTCGSGTTLDIRLAG
jgi:hypothetical protein